MAKTLVIKGANFSANKITTVEFSDVPCTGISLSESSVSFTDYDDVTVTATLTPADTTDEVIWESSDTSVATVDDGVITPVGLGTCTITATCGEQTATVSVSVAFTYISNCKSLLVTHAQNAVYAYVTANASRVSLFGSGEQASTYILPSSDLSGAQNLIKLPQNTKSVTVSATNASRAWNSTGAKIHWFKDERSGNTTYINSAKWVSETEGYNMRSTPSITVNVPEGADCMVFYVRIDPDASGTETATSIASTMGLNITFNTTEVSVS